MNETRPTDESAAPEMDDAMRHSVERGHEVRDFRTWATVLGGVGLLGLMVFSMVLVYYGLRTLVVDPETTERRPVVSNFDTPPTMFGDIAANQEFYRKRQQALRTTVLNGYSWVDREQGIARIPIDDAIEILAAREDGLRAASSGDDPMGERSDEPASDDTEGSSP